MTFYLPLIPAGTQTNFTTSIPTIKCCCEEHFIPHSTRVEAADNDKCSQKKKKDTFISSLCLSGVPSPTTSRTIRHPVTCQGRVEAEHPAVMQGGKGRGEGWRVRLLGY